MKLLRCILGIVLLNGSAGLYGQEEERRMVAGFEAVSVWGNIELHLIPGAKESLELRSEDESLSNIITEVKGGKLVIKMRAGIYEYEKVDAYLTYRTLVEIKANAAAQVRSEYVLEEDRITLFAGSGAQIDLELDTESAFLKVGEGAILEVRGKTQYLEVNARTGGILYAARLEGERVYVHIHTGGEAEVHATGSVEGKVGTGGHLEIFGDPKRDHVSTSLGGEVRRRSL